MLDQITKYRDVGTSVHFSRSGKTAGSMPVVEEQVITIILNGFKVATLVGSQDDIEELAVGYLAAEGWIKRQGDIRCIQKDQNAGVVRVDTFETKPVYPSSIGKRIVGSGYGRSVAYCECVELEKQEISSELKIFASEILDSADIFQQSSVVYQKTHGVHSAALGQKREMLVFKEDIGRHNAIDRVFGHCVLRSIPTKDRILLTSGRVCAEAIRKVALQQVPIIVSIAAPTCQAIEVARKKGITLVGSAKKGEMDVYSHDQRIIWI